jgi:DNA-directed RNA polymerase beta' subunit
MGKRQSPNDPLRIFADEQAAYASLMENLERARIRMIQTAEEHPEAYRKLQIAYLQYQIANIINALVAVLSDECRRIVDNKLEHLRDCNYGANIILLLNRRHERDRIDNAADEIRERYCNRQKILEERLNDQIFMLQNGFLKGLELITATLSDEEREYRLFFWSYDLYTITSVYEYISALRRSHAEETAQLGTEEDAELDDLVLQWEATESRYARDQQETDRLFEEEKCKLVNIQSWFRNNLQLLEIQYNIIYKQYRDAFMALYGNRGWSLWFIKNAH